MAPKKKASRGAPSKSSAQVRISSEAESRLKNLVGNVVKPAPIEDHGVVLENQKKQTEKRLRKIYDELGNEGFTVKQIEAALAAIPLSKCTMETALDWLCLNLPSNELPLKFSSGFASEDKGGSVQVLAASQPGKVSQAPKAVDAKAAFAGYQKAGQKGEEEADKGAEKDWIRQYVLQQEEDSSSDSDWESLADRSGKPPVASYVPTRKKASDPLERAVQIAEELYAAKQAALNAKSKRDKLAQVEAGNTIRALREEMECLGVSEQVELATLQLTEPVNDTDTNANMDSVEEDTAAPVPTDATFAGEAKGSSSEVAQEGAEEEEEEEGLFGLFDDDQAKDHSIPTSVLHLQQKEKIVPWGVRSSSKHQAKKNVKVEEEEARKSPRALLQQYCLKNGWTAPKYEKMAAEIGDCNYAVTVVRPTLGRGKAKKTGGPVTFTLPEGEKSFVTVADAQDAVATWAILSLFPDLPLYRLLLEPFQSLWLRWHDQGNSSKDESVDSRELFIKSLLETCNQNVPSTVEAAMKPPEISIPAQRTEQAAVAFPDATRASVRLKLVQDTKLKQTDYMKMCHARSNLPMAAVKGALLQALRGSDVVVVSGETGSGKTTQVPQYVLDDMIASGRGGFCNIICTQPRRIAAVSVAERVAVERCDSAPGNPGSIVGYQVRLDASWTSETRLLFCTTGILLRRLAGDRTLSGVSHVIVDEVHERTVLGDFLIALLKDLVARRNRDESSSLKVILMSATLDAERFSNYFGGCPVLVAEGRTFPVASFYLEDIYEKMSYRLSSDNPAAVHTASTHSKKSSRRLVDNSRGRQSLVLSGWGDETLLDEEAVNPCYDEALYRGYSETTRASLSKLNEDVIDYELLEDLILHINETYEPGGILVFLPGMPEIQQMLDRLLVLKCFQGPSADWVLPLHSSLTPGDQRRVFQNPPKGLRKIVLATNIAETSVTIEDVVHVVDCGKHKENRFDPRRRMTRMLETWISEANARQRRGRAGRVRPGNCFCLYTRHRFEEVMRPFQLPEILRVPLVELCLQIKLLSVENVSSFLEKALDPPKSEAVDNALSMLREVGALSENEELTPLGYHLSALPVDVHIGKMMLYGVLLGCLSPVLTIAAYLSHKSPFVAPFGQRDAAERAQQAFSSEATDDLSSGSSKIAAGQQSDHLVVVAAYNSWRRILTQGGSRSARQFCDANLLSIPVLTMLREMRSQFAKLLLDIGFLQKDNSRMGDWLDDLNEPFNRNANCAPIIKSVLCAGLYPNVAAMMEESILAGHANALNQRAGLASSKQPRWADGRREVFIHPSSVNSKVAEFQHPYLVYHEKVETSRVYLRDTTVLSPFALLLFGGVIKVQHQAAYVTVDDWIKMGIPARTAVLFRQLRVSLDSFLAELINSPQGLASLEGKEVVSSILKLLVEVEKPNA